MIGDSLILCTGTVYPETYFCTGSESENGHVTKTIKNSMTDSKAIDDKHFPPQQAELECLKKLIEIVKENL